jgi:hypothetical protein
VDDKRNGKSDAENVSDDGDDGGCEGFGPVKIREGHHDPIHDEVNRDAIQRARNDWALDQKSELAACQVKYGGRGEGDQKMEREAESGGGHSAVERLGTKPAGSDSLQKPRGLHAFGPPGDEGGGDVHEAAEQAGAEDGGECVGIFYASGDAGRRCQVNAPGKRL